MKMNYIIKYKLLQKATASEFRIHQYKLTAIQQSAL